MKRKKIKSLFKAIEAISNYPPNSIYGAVSNYRYRFENGTQSKPIRLLASQGKYALPESIEITQIVTSIEPKNIHKEVININREAGFPLMVLMKNQFGVNLLFINTAYGALAFRVNINKEEDYDMTDEEYRALMKYLSSEQNEKVLDMIHSEK